MVYAGVMAFGGDGLDAAGTVSCTKLIIEYWAAPTLAHACSLEVALEGSALRIRHSPPLPIDGAAADELVRITPESVSFELLMESTLGARASVRVQQLYVVFARFDDTLHTSMHRSLRVPAHKDMSGFIFVEATLSAAVINFHIRRENGLFELQLSSSGRGVDLSPWQNQLDLGCGVVQMEEAPAILIDVHRRLLLAKIVSTARAAGFGESALKFDTARGQHGDSANAAAQFAQPSPYTVFLPIAVASQDGRFESDLHFYVSITVCANFTVQVLLAAVVVAPGSADCLRYRVQFSVPVDSGTASTAKSLSFDTRPAKRQALGGGLGTVALAHATNAELRQLLAGWIGRAESVAKLRCSDLPRQQKRWNPVSSQ